MAEIWNPLKAFLTLLLLLKWKRLRECNGIFFKYIQILMNIGVKGAKNYVVDDNHAVLQLFDTLAAT